MLKVNRDVALLYGILLGDGCLSLVNGKSKFITITGSLDNDLPFFEDVVSPLLERLCNKKINFRFRKDCRAIEFNFVNSQLFDYIHSLGFPIGKKGTEITIPKLFYENDLIKFVIQGFVATDGSLVLTDNNGTLYPRIEAHAICKFALEQMCYYLNKVGMSGHFYQCKRSKYYSRWGKKEIFRFQFNGRKNLLLFNDLIGFINPSYKLKFDKYMALGRIELPVPAS